MPSSFDAFTRFMGREDAADDALQPNAARTRTLQEEKEMKMTFADFSKANRLRCESVRGFNHPLNGWSLSDWMVAAIGELGEAANVAKKLNRVRDGIPGNKEATELLRHKLRKEIGDTFVYLDLLAQSAGFTIEEAAREVFNEKSLEIGYPGTV